MGCKREDSERTSRFVFVVTVCLFVIPIASAHFIEGETVSRQSVLEVINENQGYKNLKNTVTTKHSMLMKSYPFFPFIATSQEEGDTFSILSSVAEPYAHLRNSGVLEDDHKEGKEAKTKTYSKHNSLSLYLNSKLTSSINEIKRQKRRIFNDDLISAVFNKHSAEDHFSVPAETTQKALEVTEISNSHLTQERASTITESRPLERENEGLLFTILVKEPLESVSEDFSSETNTTVIMPKAENVTRDKISEMQSSEQGTVVTTESIPVIQNEMELMDSDILKDDMNFTIKDTTDPVIIEKEPVRATIIESDTETEPEPELEPEPETILESGVKSEPDVEPETAKAAEAEIEPEPEVEPETVQHSEFEAEPGAEAQAEPVAETQPESGAEPKLGQKAKPSPENEPEGETISRSKALRGTEKQPKLELKPKAEPNQMIEAKPEGEKEPEAEPNSEPEPEIGPETTTGTDSVLEMEPESENLVTLYQSLTELAEEPKPGGTHKSLSEQEPEAEPEEEPSELSDQNQTTSQLKMTTDMSGSVLSQQELMDLEPEPEPEMEKDPAPGRNSVTKEPESVTKPLSGLELTSKNSMTLNLQSTIDTMAELNPESELQSETIMNSESEPDIIANAEPEPEVEPQINTNTEPEHEVETNNANPEPEPEVEPDSITNPEPEPEVEPDTIENPEPEPETKPEPNPDTEPETGMLKDHPGGSDFENYASQNIITEHVNEEDLQIVSKNNSASSLNDEEKVKDVETLINEDLETDQEEVTTEIAENSGNMTLNDTSPVTDEGTTLGGINWTGSRITLFIVQFIIMIETVIGNLMVILSVKIEKKLQTPFNYYIVNLAFTDFNVGLSVMSLFMIYNLYDYFPFNNTLCSYWIWSDYTMTFESVMTLAAISVDRLWSVTWSLHYRNHNSGKKSLMIILGTWTLVATIWLPPFIYDRVVNTYEPGICYWDTVLNKNLVIWVGFMGYYSPLFIMIGAYARIMWVVKKRAASIRDAVRKDNPAPSQPTETSVSGDGPTEQKKLVNAAPVVDERQEAKLKREMKAVYTLLNIVVIFLICWVPFYILFVLSAWFPTLFPDWYVNFAYWMAYINSAVNPVLYPLSSLEFRAAYKKIFYMLICKK